MPYCGGYQNWLWQIPVDGTSSKQKSGAPLGCVTLLNASCVCVTNTPWCPLELNVTLLLSALTPPCVSAGTSWKLNAMVGPAWMNAGHVTGDPIRPGTVA